MQILASFCLLAVFCNVIELYRKFLQIFLGFLVMECASRLKFLTQGYHFGVFGCSSQILIPNFLGLFFMFGLGLKVLQSTSHHKGLMQFFRGKFSFLRNGFCFRDSNRVVCGSKILSSSSSCSSDSVKFLEKPSSVKSRQLLDSSWDPGAKDVLKEYCDGHQVECCDCEEDDEFDVVALRKLIKMQRHRANAALVELEKERMAAASAADEAMAMILRLQNEKSTVEMEANQYRRLAEQKQHYDQQVIRSLRWVIMKHESTRSLVEDSMVLCTKRLKQCFDFEENQFETDDSNVPLFNSFTEEGFDDVPISSLEFDYGTLEL